MTEHEYFAADREADYREVNCFGGGHQNIDRYEDTRQAVCTDCGIQWIY